MPIDHFESHLQTYSDISTLVKTYNHHDIFSHVLGLCNATAEDLMNLPIGSRLKGNVTGIYQFVLEDIEKNISRYDQVYELLADDTSKTVFTHLMQYRLIPDARFLKAACDNSSQPESILANYINFTETDFNTNEIPGILNAKDTIRTSIPMLTLCVSHIISDIWEIPLLLKTIYPEYKFYLRHYSPDQNRQTILYAIPKATSNAGKKTPKTCVALPWREGWTNVELTKDCGLIPYLLYKNHDMDVTMTGTDKGPYPYLDAYVKGLHMHFLTSGSLEEKLQYIEQHGKEIDLLLLRGAYDINIDIAQRYKKVNPAGKIYVGLDANSHWMDRILWHRPDFMAFLDCCDVIATSCRAMQKHLNEKWPWKIEYIPNGYYNYDIPRKAPVFENKQNVILTVSRIGTEQKATPVLLEAFARIAEQVPDWKLKLVGPIEPSFQSEINKFFTTYPHLASRVEFTGPIQDKNKLYEEYLNAKIFALPSLFEGGTPNVVSEALTAGCVMAVTKFDAWEDAVDNGNCGMASELEDTAGFSRILLALCQHPELNRLSQNAYHYAQRNFDMPRIVAKLYEMLFGGDFI